MTVALLTPETQSTRRLPPAEAWNEPEKWIDTETGLALPGVKKIILPTDDRRFVKTDAAVEYVLDTLFKTGYEWNFDYDDPETRPDEHHFYYERADYSSRANNGSLVPYKFRRLPTLIGRMPRQLHNAFHDLTVRPEIPEIEAMQNYIDAYALAYNAFKNLFDTAKITVEAMKMFPQRRQDVALGRVIPKTEDDYIGEEYMRSFFKEHFSAYSDAVDAFIATENKDIIYPDYSSIEKAKPHQVVSKLGRVVSRTCIDYVTAVKRAA